MAIYNINHGLATPHLVRTDLANINGCSGELRKLQNVRATQVSRFDKPVNRNIWDLLMAPSHDWDESTKPGTNKRLSVVIPPDGYRVPSPARWFKPPANYSAYYLKSGDDIVALIGVAKPDHFDKPDSKPAAFVADPEKYASLRHLEQAGVYSDRIVKGSTSRDMSKPAARLLGNQVLLSSAVVPHQVGRVSAAWSPEFDLLTSMPWWELCRLAQCKYATPETITQTIVDTAAQKFASSRALLYVAGNAAMTSPNDSFRAVFCFHELNPEATMDLAATPALATSSGKQTVYYKVLPFYYHSPQHRDHRVACCILSHRPIHLERIS